MQDAPPPASLFSMFVRAAGAVLRNGLSVLVVFGLVGACSALVQDFLLQWGAGVVTDVLPRQGVYLTGQKAFLIGQMVAFLPMVAFSCVVGALTVPWAIRFYQMSQTGEGVRWEGVIAFGFERWKHVIWPYTQATLAIQLGSIVVVPGVLFALFYAFVGPVAALDEEVKRPLARSTKLTRGRRGRLFRAGLLFSPWVLWYGLVGVYESTAWGVPAVIGLGVLDEFFSLILFLIAFQMYEERMQELRALLAARRNDDGDSAELD